MPSDSLVTILKHQQGSAFKTGNWTIMVLYPTRIENKPLLNYPVTKGLAEQGKSLGKGHKKKESFPPPIFHLCFPPF